MRELELSKQWARDKFFKLRKWKFWERQFFSLVTFKWKLDIPLLINLFIPLIERRKIH